MQLIGIYIDNEKNCEVRKALNENWYPFGNFEIEKEKVEITNSLFEKTQKEIAEKLHEIIVKNNQSFINQLYALNQDEKPSDTPNSKIKINLNCIVGKNGSGKSTLLDILMRLLNNLGCKIKSVNPELYPNFNPEWANEIKARLYFESGDSIWCLKVKQPEKIDNFNNSNIGDNVQLFKDGSEDIFKTISKDAAEKIQEEIQEKIMDHIPYTIMTNYSLYNGYDEEDSNKTWIDKLYQKNDGYITPIVLAPYKKENQIDIKKENKIGKERVGYLSMLLKNNEDFIENYTPVKIDYELYNINDYMKKHKCPEECTKECYESNKLDTLVTVCTERYSNYQDFYKNKLGIIKDNIKKEIERIYKKLYDIWTEELKIEPDKSQIEKYTLTYLAAKSLKIALIYESYQKLFKDNNLDENLIKLIHKLSPYYDNEDNNTSDFFEEKRDHINLKIFQTICFMETFKTNKIFKKKKGTIYVDEFLNKIKQKNKNKLTYDDIVESFFPPFYTTKIYYAKKSDIKEKGYENKSDKKICNEDKISKILLTQMSSGEQQLYFSLSYAVYHIKNIESVKISTIKNGIERLKYKNINLILDEAELYYHPEYQRMYIKNLLDVLRRSNFNPEDIKSINITIVTHSPYLISDIPATNILQLEDGKVKNSKEKTFCANYYDLLKNQFFLSSSIGGIAEKYINEILEFGRIQEKIETLISIKKENEKNDSYKENIKIINSKITSYKEKIKKYNTTFYSKIIDSIGDEYLRKSLERIHNIIIEKQKSYNEELK